MSYLTHEKINIDKLLPLIDKLQGEPVDLSNRSSRGEKSIQYNLFNYIENFKEAINLVVDNLSKNKKYKLLSAWTVIGEEDSYHLVHKHNGYKNHIATVLYLKVPKKQFHKSGDFYYFFKDKNGNIKKETISPEVGSLIVMPINTYHGAYPQGEGIRQTLNLDFEVIDYER